MEKQAEKEKQIEKEHDSQENVDTVRVDEVGDNVNDTILENIHSQCQVHFLQTESEIAYNSQVNVDGFGYDVWIESAMMGEVGEGRDIDKATETRQTPSKKTPTKKHSKLLIKRQLIQPHKTSQNQDNDEANVPHTSTIGPQSTPTKKMKVIVSDLKSDNSQQVVEQERGSKATDPNKVKPDHPIPSGT